MLSSLRSRLASIPKILKNGVSKANALKSKPKLTLNDLASSLGAGAATALAGYSIYTYLTAPNYAKIRGEIEDVLDNLDYEDGSMGPVLVRLAWHNAGTYSMFDGTGGSEGAGMRFGPEAGDDANAGLHVARDLLEKIKEKHPEISYSDLWSLAGTVAIEALGGPTCAWIGGRKDYADASEGPPQGRLPDATRNADHLRAVFYRMGFSDQEIVALSGAHVLGRCHSDRSGFEGPWVNSMTTFSNEYFRELFENQWTVKNWKGPLQYEDKSGALMMLPTDMELKNDPEFRVYAEKYWKDQDLFFKDFAKAWTKLMHLGFTC
eukprot:CAMPEP_0197518676 /NCGR_PEP_ID=MMETSP1318-20131121/3898_1 /TAXON_ID=552666 /ORGANISM="Partenskyella glossopodia, Strain RCC365" /LENGTH=319 /DNA_ID=CAMNT_0043069205 /DNA_START=37 /DNA_END=996 /DNA_ORIENTATION=-